MEVRIVDDKGGIISPQFKRVLEGVVIAVPPCLIRRSYSPSGDPFKGVEEPIASPEACTKGQHLLKSRCLDPSSLIVLILTLKELLVDRQAALISGLNSQLNSLLTLCKQKGLDSKVNYMTNTTEAPLLRVPSIQLLRKDVAKDVVGTVVIGGDVSEPIFDAVIIEGVRYDCSNLNTSVSLVHHRQG